MMAAVVVVVAVEVEAVVAMAIAIKTEAAVVVAAAGVETITLEVEARVQAGTVATIAFRKHTLPTTVAATAVDVVVIEVAVDPAVDMARNPQNVARTAVVVEVVQASEPAATPPGLQALASQLSRVEKLQQFMLEISAQTWTEILFLRHSLPFNWMCVKLTSSQMTKANLRGLASSLSEPLMKRRK